MRDDMAADRRAVVLVEGPSDQLAVEALARRRGHDLAAKRVGIMAIGGATNILKYLRMYGPDGADARLAGLVDQREEQAFKLALDRAGLGKNLSRGDMEALGFYVCQADLEDELIRALGPATVERVIESQGELELFRTFQRQPPWRDRTEAAQLRRFFGTLRGRKIRCSALLVDALDLNRVPRPLDGVLNHVLTTSRRG